MINKVNILLLISFIEGGVVMIAELCGAKLLAPYFGTSVHVWAATLAVTLGGLMVGYFLGGYLSKKGKEYTDKYLFITLCIASVFILLTPWISKFSLNTFIDFPLETGALFSLLIFLFPVLICLGCTSPLIITALSKDNDPAGVRAGQVYAISTMGGIVFTLFAGFYSIPILGIQASLLLAGLLLGGITLLAFLSINSLSKKQIGIATIFLFTGSVANFAFENQYNPKFNVIYESDGLLGNLKVIEHTSEDFTRRPKRGRGLVVNNTLQTYMDLNGENISIWEWSHFLPSIASIYPENSKDLIIGLGGGTLLKQLNRLNHQVNVVEIDQRIKDISIEYFNVGPHENIVVNDARNFVKNSKEKYDIIFYDAFLSESVPEHLLTLEGFKEAKKILNEQGSLIVNFYGFINGEKGYAARSVMKTLVESGFQLYIFATPGDEEYRNLIIHAKLGDTPNYNTNNYQETNKPIINLSDYLMDTQKTIHLGKAEILNDNRPNLSLHYAKAAKSWRKGYNEIYTKKLYK